MADLHLRARSATELVDAAVQLYRRDALKYILLTALAYAPWVVLQLIVLGMAGAAPTSTTMPLVMLSYVGMFIGFAVMSAALSRVAASAYLGEHREIDEALREVLPGIPAVVVSTLLKYVMFMVGLLFLIVGALYIAARYFATTQVIVLEGTGVSGAFARSSALSRGQKRHIFNTQVLVWVIYFVLSMGAVMLAGPGGEMVMTIVSSLVTVVVYPIVGIAEVLLYYDARIRQEGYDIEVMARALDPAPAG
jgi:hypothetical protein